MTPVVTRILFYGGNLVVVVLMVQDVTRRAIVSVLGDSTGSSLYDFIRTNVELPITLIVVALYLDLVLSHRQARPGRSVP